MDISSAQSRTLDLSRLKTDVPALTDALGSTLIEACMVCFQDQGHLSGVELEVTGTYNEQFTVVWQGEITERMQLAWLDEEATTEDAACGIAILLIQELTGYTVLRPAARGEGIDYWLGRRGKDADQPYEYVARLEVSGVRRGSASRIEARVRQKATQTERSAGEYPAYIAVVEFGKPQVRMMKK